MPKDLKAAPFKFTPDLKGSPDGRAIVRVEVQSGSRSLGVVQLAIDLQAGLDERVRKLESGWNAIKGFDTFRGDVLYPADYVRNVNE